MAHEYGVSPNIEDWVTGVYDGRGALTAYRLNDPVSGAPLSNGTPKFILDDPKFSGAVDLAAQLGPHVELGITYTDGTDVGEAIGEDAEFEEALQDPRYNTHIVAHTVDGPERGASGLLQMHFQSETAFTRRIDAAIPAGVLGVCIGLEKDYRADFMGKPFGPTEQIIDTVNTSAAKEAERCPEEPSALIAMAIARTLGRRYKVLNFTKEIVMALSIMNDSQGLTDPTLNVVMLAPVIDAAIGGNFRAMGYAPVETLASDNIVTDDVDEHTTISENGMFYV